jgi:hypothetical protein
MWVSPHIIPLVSRIIVSLERSGLFHQRNDGFVSQRRGELVSCIVMTCGILDKRLLFHAGESLFVTFSNDEVDGQC